MTNCKNRQPLLVSGSCHFAAGNNFCVDEMGGISFYDQRRNSIAFQFQ